MDSCELAPGGEEREASPQHQCTKRETKGVRKVSDCELKTYKRACWQRNIPPFAGVQRYEGMKNHSPTAPSPKPLASPCHQQRSCLSRPTDPFSTSALLPSEGFSSPSLQASSSSPSEALLLPPKRYYCCHPRGATGATREALLVPPMKDYGYLDYGTIASLLSPPLLPPKRYYYRLLQNRTFSFPISPQPPRDR